MVTLGDKLPRVSIPPIPRFFASVQGTVIGEGSARVIVNRVEHDTVIVETEHDAVLVRSDDGARNLVTHCFFSFWLVVGHCTLPRIIEWAPLPRSVSGVGDHSRHNLGQLVL